MSKKKPAAPLPAAQRRPGEPSDTEHKLTLILPKDIVQRAKHRAVDEGTTVKAIVLRGLEAELRRR